jgi:hypothetical protein
MATLYVRPGLDAEGLSVQVAEDEKNGGKKMKNKKNKK